MKYRIEVQRSAAKALKKIPEPDRKRISKKIDSLAEQFPSHDETKMKGNNPFRVLPASALNFAGPDGVS